MASVKIHCEGETDDLSNVTEETFVYNNLKGIAL